MPLINTSFGENTHDSNTEMSHSTTDSMEEQQTEDIVSSLTITSNNSNTTSLSPADERDRKQFALEIHRFMAEIGKPLSKIPIMGYKELDLYQLFKEVTAHGGFNEVVKNVGTWSKIWKRLGNFDPSITDSSFRLKKNYERYLLEYEFKCFPEHRLQAMEFQEKSSLKRSNSSNNLLMVHSPLSSPSSSMSSPNISRPHSPSSVSNGPSMMQFSHTNSSPSSSSSSNIYLSHNSPESPHSYRGGNSKDSKDKSNKSIKAHKSKRKSSRENSTPSRSNSFNAPSSSPMHISTSSTSPKFPLLLGDLTVESLGVIIPKYPYVVNNQVYPVGFTSSRMFSSRINPDREVRYVSQIIDAGDRPEFIVVASDDLDHPIISYESPSECWRNILQHFRDTDDSNSNSSELSSDKLSVSGRLRFGLTHPDIASYLREMPNSDKASDVMSSMSPSPTMSPSSKRKYKNISDDSADEGKQKAQKYGDYFSRRNFASRDDMDDLESAVATLQGLKHCLVF